MIVAIASLGLNVSLSFKKSDGFTCYTVDHGIITDVHNLPNTMTTPAELLKAFKAIGISTLIVNKINVDVASLFCDNGIEVIAGTSGTCSSVIKQYLTNELIAGDDSCGN